MAEEVIRALLLARKAAPQVVASNPLAMPIRLGPGRNMLERVQNGLDRQRLERENELNELNERKAAFELEVEDRGRVQAIKTELEEKNRQLEEDLGKLKTQCETDCNKAIEAEEVKYQILMKEYNALNEQLEANKKKNSV